MNVSLGDEEACTAIQEMRKFGWGDHKTDPGPPQVSEKLVNALFIEQTLLNMILQYSNWISHRQTSLGY